MRKCPLNNFRECIGEECPFYNVKLGTCILPRLILSQIKANEKTYELKEEKTCEPTTTKSSSYRTRTKATNL